MHHSEFVAAGIEVVGLCRDSVEHNRSWSERLALPYPLLADVDGAVGRSLGVLRSIRLGAWTVEFLRRSTLLVGIDGRIAAAWSDVKIRGHARAVLEVAGALALRSGEAIPPPPNL